MKFDEQVNRIKTMMGIVAESKKTEAVANAWLKKNNVQNADNIIRTFAKNDNSKNQKNIPFMAFIYTAWNYRDVNNIITIVNKYEKLLTTLRIKPAQIQQTEKKVTINGQTFTNFLNFAEYIHGEENKYNNQTKDKEYETIENMVPKTKPIWQNDMFDIYEGNTKEKCIQYTMGGLTGKKYSFCIGQPLNTMFQSYRDLKDSTFYFIIDKTKIYKTKNGIDMSDPLHIIVFDNTKNGIELTDANNRTNKLAKPYDENSNKYLDYLKNNGVPVEMLINKPKTEQEKKEEQILKYKNNDLQWFKQLPFEYKSKYIGRGHLLTNDQFDYLIGEN